MNLVRPTLFALSLSLSLAAAGCGDDAQTHTTAADETTTTATTGADTVEQPGTVPEAEDTSGTQAGGTAPETTPH